MVKLSDKELDIVNDIINNNKSFTFNQQNKKRQGAHDRYEKYKSSKNYEEFKELGGKGGDFRNDYQKGFIILDDIGDNGVIDDDNGDNEEIDDDDEILSNSSENSNNLSPVIEDVVETAEEIAEIYMNYIISEVSKPEINVKDILKKYDSNNLVDKYFGDDNKLKYIDLFCGIGGFHQALSSLGCECNLACDIDKDCCINYELNYGIKPVEDVKKINPAEIQDLDIICGGYPCQPFSNSGKKKALNDDRGLLFDEIIRIAKVKRPKFMFLENVKHILKVDGGKVITYIRKKLDDNNYTLQLLNMSPHNYGIPQQRERIYHICVRKDIYNGTDVELPEIQDTVIELDKYMLKEEEVDPKYKIDGDVLKCLEAWDEMIKIFEVDEKISPVIMINEHYNNHTQDDFDNYATWRKEYITANKPLINKYKDKWDIWYEKHKEIIQKREIFGKLEWQVGKVKPNDSIFNYFIQIRQSGIRVKKPHFFPTLVAINQCPIYGKQKRYITPRECARLQSFPEDFKIDPVDSHAYKQFGNSVNCDNVKTVIKATFDHYGVEC